MKIKKSDLLSMIQEQNDVIAKLIRQVNCHHKDIIRIEGIVEPEPQLKQLDQSAFKEWADCWKFFATDEDGDAWRYREKPQIDSSGKRWLSSNTVPLLIGKGYDASNWQNSLIERDTAKELLEVDLSSELTGSELCKAMLERGDKYIVCTVDYGVVVITGSNKDGSFFSTDCAYTSATPINNQGEPLTASEVGL